MNQPAGFHVSISRPFVGWCALLCLSAAAAGWIVAFHTESEGDSSVWVLLRGPFTRVGLVMAAVWIAMPARKRLDVAPKVFVLAMAALIGVALRPRIVIPLLIVLAVLAYVLRPRDKTARQKQLSRQYRNERADTSSPPRET